MGSSILSVGISGLNAAQVGLSVTGNNIANASTPGYTRQAAVQTSAKEQNFGFGFLGQGTSVSQIKRFYDDLLSTQVNNAQSSSSEVDIYASQMTVIDDLLGDGTAGLSPALSDFFNSISVVASNPSSNASRQAFVSTANSLQSRFNDLALNLQQAQSAVNSQIQQSALTINSYSKQLADLNVKIDAATSATQSAPNALLDQRDFIVNELSKQINTTVVKQLSPNNSMTNIYNVYVGNGQPLVVGDTSYEVSAVTSPSDSTKLDLAYKTAGGATLLMGEQNITGGMLGGLFQFRTKSLDVIQNQIGQIGIALADSYNAQNRLGTDASGAAGTDLFEIPAPDVLPNGRNTGSGVMAAAIVDSSALPSSNFQLKYDGTNYVIKRLSDGVEQSFASLPQTLNGVDFQLASGTMNTGDSFLIKPTINGALNFKSIITDGSKLAAGSTPFTGPGDNTNALKLAELNTKLTMDGGTNSYSSAYNKLVSAVGIKSNELRLSVEAESGFLKQAEASQQSLSGVNLDEEAANLLRYQQAYQASGKLIKIVSDLFDTLINMR